MRKATVSAVATAALLLLPAAPAFAGGSDDPTPYTVDGHGITLPAGATFHDGGHVNVEYLQGGEQHRASIHFEELNNQPSGKFIDQDFISWADLGVPVEEGVCVCWAQVDGFNEHFGEQREGSDHAGTQGGTKDCQPVTPEQPEQPETPAPESPSTPAPPTVSPSPVPSEPAPEETPTTDAPSAPDETSPADASASPTASAPSVPGMTEDTDVTAAPDTESTTDDESDQGDEGVEASSVVADTEVTAEESASTEVSPAPVAAQSASALAQTGATVTGVVIAAVVLLAAGAGLVVGRRRRLS